MKVEVRIVRVDCGEERIGLSFIHAEFGENDDVRKNWAEAQEAKAAKKAAKKTVRKVAKRKPAKRKTAKRKVAKPVVATAM